MLKETELGDDFGWGSVGGLWDMFKIQVSITPIAPQQNDSSSLYQSLPLPTPAKKNETVPVAGSASHLPKTVLQLINAIPRDHLFTFCVRHEHDDVFLIPKTSLGNSVCDHITDNFRDVIKFGIPR